jgi:hypothetical protein
MKRKSAMQTMISLFQARFYRLAFAVCAAIVICGQRCEADGVHPSVWVYPSNDGDLLYATDTSGVRINDFSECGYKRGLVELPNLTNLVDSSHWIYLHPLGGTKDDGAGINAALTLVASFGINANGFCGVVCLGPGIYQVSDTNAIRLTNDGVILKGSGTSGASFTELKAISPNPYALVSVEGAGDRNVDSSSAAMMVEPFVPAGTRTFRVNTTNGFLVGDSVVVHHPGVAAWLHDIDMDQLVKPWTPPGFDRDYERVITRIEGNWITVDTPVPQTFQANYGGGYIAHFSGLQRVQNCGVQDLVCCTPFIVPDAQANPAVLLTNTVDTWVRNVTAYGCFSYTIWVQAFSKFITVAQCTNYTTDSVDYGLYAFYFDKDAEYALVRDCLTDNSRHNFVCGSPVAGPVAFVRCQATNARDETGPHERWSTGVLLDNVSVDDELNIQNRGNSGKGLDGHGWTGAFSAVWNCYAEDGFRVRSPYTARNWLIGSDGDIMESKRGCAWNNFWNSLFFDLWASGDCWAVGADPAGSYDQSGPGSPPVQLHSLYYAQLQQRLKWPGSQFREYRLGDIGWNPGNDNNIPIDPYWLAQVQVTAGTATVANTFDVVDPNQWTAFTFNFPIAPQEQVVAASLSLVMDVPPGDHHLYLNSAELPLSFTNLGWVPSYDGAVRYTVAVPPNAIQYGQLNVALDGNCGVDFAMLNFQVAPIIPPSTEHLTPQDAYVRGGDYADQNYATNSELIVKNDSDASFSRRAFLNWDLAEATNFGGPLIDAKVRLYCKYSGQTGNEQSVAVVPDDAWSPVTVTWSNQPATDPPFAYFVPEPGYFVEFTVTPQLAAVYGIPGRHFSLCIDSAHDWGSHGDLAYASAEDPDPTHWPQLILSFTNSPPGIIGPSSQSMDANSTLGPLPVTIGDAETAASSLTLSATSSVPSAIADSEILLGGSGSNRTVTITVPAGRIGDSIVTLIVSDGAQVSTTAFRVRVGCILTVLDPPPSISPIANVSMNEDTTLAVPFHVSSLCGDTVLSIRGSSSNPGLFPAGSLQVVPHSGTDNRALLLTPAPNQNGSATISISASISVVGGIIATNRTFGVTVRSVQHPPQYVTITSPLGGANLQPGLPVLLSANAFDVESNLARIEFYDQANRLLGTASNAPYSAIWSNPVAGRTTLSAVAYDAGGLSTTSPAVSVTVSVPPVYPPTLAIGSLSNTVAVVWLSSISSNALQTATNLVPPVFWSPVTNASPVESDGAWFYFVSPNESRRFYRLAY